MRPDAGSRTWPLKLCLGAVLGAALACSETTPTEPEFGRFPNVILVLADDLGQGDLRAYRPDTVIPTPNVDRLAREGMRFTDAHSPSSVCSPARYALMTGRYAWRAGSDGRALRYFDPPLIEVGRLTLPELLRRAGYATAAVGKWHLGLNVPALGGTGYARMRGQRLPANPDFSAEIEGGPLDLGFDSYFGAQLTSVRAFVRDRRFTSTPRLSPDGEDFRVAGWRAAQRGKIQLAEALEVIERLHTETPGRPFFLYFATHYPHKPFAPAVAVDGTPVRGTSGAGPRGDLVVELDVVLGRLLDRLDALDVARDTLVILTSDNGADPRPTRAGRAFRVNPDHDHDPSGGWRGGKGSLWEGGHRVPFIARWGDGTAAGSTIPPGTVSHRLIGLQDLMATAAELVGAPLPSDAAEDSASFLAVLLGRDAAPPRQEMMHRSADGRFAFRHGDWKLILEPRTAAARSAPPRRGKALYNLADDPGETVDLAARHPDVVTRLTARFTELRQPATGRTAGSGPLPAGSPLGAGMSLGAARRP